MTAQHVDYDVGRAFLEASRRYLTEDYLPRLKSALDRLPEADLWWRPNAASNSVGNLLLHLAGNARQWVVSGVGGGADVRRREAEFSALSGSSAAELWVATQGAVEDVAGVLARLDPAVLGERRTIQGKDVTVLEAIYHVVEHFSMHTGQILYVVKLRTGEDLGLWRVDSEGNAEPAWGDSKESR